MNTNELLSDKKELNNVKDILKDTLQADPKALERLDNMNLDMDAIKTALTFLYNNPKIGEKERNELVTESWRIGYRAKPPSPEEFLTEKYLGPVATHTYDRVKKVFFEFLDPTQGYRNLILFMYQIKTCYWMQNIRIKLKKLKKILKTRLIKLIIQQN